MQDFRISQWLDLTMCQMVNSYWHFKDHHMSSTSRPRDWRRLSSWKDNSILYGYGQKRWQRITEMHTGHASWNVHDNEQKIWSFSTDDATW